MGLFSSKTETTKQPFETNPWERQQPFLMQGFDQASGALEGGLDTLSGVNDFTADMTDNQNDFINQMMNNSQGAAATGQDAMSAGSSTFGNLGTYSDNLSRLMGEAGQDRTGDIISGAQQFADNPYMQDQIDSAISDVRRGFDRNVASINAGATGSGNINSTRAGALEARALDDASDRAADISTSMRGAAYSEGLDRATQEEARQFGDQMTANQGIGGTVGMGMNLANGGYTMGQGALQSGLDAATLEQIQAQNEINGSVSGASAPMNLINRYMQAIGGNYGSQGYQSQTSKQASPFQQLVGGGATLMGAWGSM